jgi:hypothetical protein
VSAQTTGAGSRVRRAGWLLALAAAVGALVAVRVLQVDVRAGRAAAGLLAVVLVAGLAARCGARPWPPALLALVGAGAAGATALPLLLSAMAVATGVIGAVLAVMATTPAPTFVRAVREVVVVVLLAATAALGVAGWAAPMSALRYGYVALGLALLGALTLVYSLGAGLHGLGRRGTVVAVAAVLLLAVALAYGEALSHWGSPELIAWADRVRAGTRSTLHAVPHPIEVLLGVPALAWGVVMRARRRQGWWVTAFGTTLTAPMTTRLVDHGVALETTGLSLIYSLVLGLLLAWLVIRVDQALTGSHGRRSRRDGEGAAHRPEPARMAALH